MTVEFRPLALGHLRSIIVQPEQAMEQIAMIEPGYEALLIAGKAEGAWVGPRIVAAAGLGILIPGELAIAWCLLSPRAGRYLASITQRCRRVLTETPIVRVEMTVNSDIKNGERWATALGFTRETVQPLRKRGKGGKDQHIFARVL